MINFVILNIVNSYKPYEILLNIVNSYKPYEILLNLITLLFHCNTVAKLFREQIFLKPRSMYR